MQQIPGIERGRLPPQSPQRRSDTPQEQQSTADSGSPLQGEGDYDAARRYREAATEHAQHDDVEREAREAAPRSPEEARDMRDAERAGRERGRGEDRRDVMGESAIDSPADDKAT